MKKEIKYTGKEAGILQQVADSIIGLFRSIGTVNELVRMPVALIITITLLSASAGMGGTINPDSAKKISASMLKADMRQLLEDHVTLTRDVILCLVDNRSGIDSTVNEIVNNQVEIANLMKRYYGNEAGKELAGLLYRNITRAADVMIACRNGHNKAYTQADKKWRESADEIVAFLTQVNPSWRMYGSRKILYDQMTCTTEEIRAIRDKDSDCDAQAYDKARNDAQALADLLAETIIQHFPEMFQDIEESMPPTVGQN